jgi:NADH-quinone oxidoreductase subunit E
MSADAQAVQAMALLRATLARFAREVAKYPADQKQSAVMACLAIVQQEQGHVSPEAEKASPTTWACPPSRCTRSPPSTTCTTSARWASSSSTSAPTCRASCATAARRCSTWSRSWASHGRTTADGLFTLQQSECLGACADSPVMLVNDRHMCSFMSNDKLDQLIDGLKAAEGQA